ncbi:hypothetical protein pb186bvf_001926 [Paramecium bursaria]
MILIQIYNNFFIQETIKAFNFSKDQQNSSITQPQFLLDKDQIEYNIFKISIKDLKYLQIQQIFGQLCIKQSQIKIIYMNNIIINLHFIIQILIIFSYLKCLRTEIEKNIYYIILNLFNFMCKSSNYIGIIKKLHRYACPMIKMAKQMAG